MLCLDADRAGQDAMLRAAQLTDQRKLELRVVPLPEGTDPADLIERAGADALRERVDASVPFVAFHVDRILERNDTRSAEGRDEAFRQLQPALKGLRRGLFGDALLRRVAARLELTEAQLGSLIEGAHSRTGRHDRVPGPAPRRRSTPAHAPSECSWRSASRFPTPALARCSRSTSTSSSPASCCGGPPGTSPAGRIRRWPICRRMTTRLARTVAASWPTPDSASRVSPGRAQHARLVLERDRLDRAIRRARAEGATEIPELARERETVLERHPSGRGPPRAGRVTRAERLGACQRS